MYVYLATPIDFATSDVYDVVRGVEEILDMNEIPYYSPNRAWNLSGTSGLDMYSGITAANENALANARIIVAVMFGNSIGIPAELRLAKAVGIPSVIYTTEDIMNSSVALRALCTGRIITDLRDLLPTVQTYFKTKAGGTMADQISEQMFNKMDTVLGMNMVTRVGRIMLEPGVPDTYIPKQAKRGDIGLDMYASEDTIVGPMSWAEIPSGIRVAPPEDLWFMIVGRSSTLHKRGLIVPPSIIDSGYRGLLYSMAYNIRNERCYINKGDRIAQLLPLALTKFEFTKVDELPDSDRGSSGFGSTGI